MNNNPISDEVKDIAAKIGQFYLQKHNGNYEEAEKEIISLHISKIEVTNEFISVNLMRVGKFIGKRGENVTNLETFLGKKVKIFENTDSLLNYLIPFDEIAYAQEMEADYKQDLMENAWTDWEESAEDYRYMDEGSHYFDEDRPY